MKARTSYAWTTEDASRDFVVEAYNRLRNFIAEDQDDLEPERTAYRRAILSGSDFSADDIVGVVNLLEKLATRADVRAHQYSSGALVPVGPEVVPALTQAVECAVQAAGELTTMFSRALLSAWRVNAVDLATKLEGGN